MSRDERGGYGRDRGRDDDRGRGRDDRDDDRGRDRGRDDDRGRGRDRDRDDGRRSGRDDDRGGRRGRFEYHKRDDEEARRRADSGGKDFDVYIKDHVDFFKPADKVNTIRILPPTWDGAKHYGVDIWLHYRIGADRQSYLCLNKMKGEKCPICEERADATRTGDDKYAKDLAPTRRVLVYLIDRDHEREGVKAWAMPQNLDRDIVKVSQDRRSGEVLPIDHPDEGYDVFFEKKGASVNTEYLGAQVDRRDSPLGNDKWLEFAQDNPLPDQLVYYSYDHIKNVFAGGGVSRGDDRDNDRGRDGRDRDDRGSRGRDERDDRGRSRDDDRGRDRDEGRGSSRDDDRGRDRDRGRSDEPTWDSVHDMRPRELEALIDEKRLKINPKEAKDDADLADWICEELGLRKPSNDRGRDSKDDDRGRDDKGGDDVNRKLEDMRNRRRD